MRCFWREIVFPPASWEETTFETTHYSRVKKKKKIVPNSLLLYSVYLKTLSLNYLSCQQIWVIEKEKDRENEKAGARLAKLNEKKSEKELDNGGETSLTSNEKQSKKEIEKEGETVLTSNGKKSGRELEKIDAGLATSSEEVSGKQQEKTGAAQT